MERWYVFIKTSTVIFSWLLDMKILSHLPMFVISFISPNFWAHFPIIQMNKYFQLASADLVVPNQEGMLVHV